MSKLIFGFVAIFLFLIVPVFALAECEVGKRKCINGYIHECKKSSGEEYKWINTYIPCRVGYFSYLEETSENACLFM